MGLGEKTASLYSTHGRFCFHPEEVVQVYGFCIRTLRFPVISVIINGVMRLVYLQVVGFRRYGHTKLPRRTEP